MKIMMLLGRATGGIGAHVDSLVGALREQGHEVIIVTADETAQRFGWLDAHRLWPLSEGRGLPVGPLKWHRIMKLAGQVDVVHAHGIQAAVVGAAAVFRARPKPGFIVSLHNQLPDDAPAAYRRVVVQSMRSADLATGASSDLVELAERLGAPSWELAAVPAPLVPELLDATQGSDDWTAVERDRLFRDTGISRATDVAGRPLVLTVSRIAPQKNLPVFLDAARRSTRNGVWVIVGGGDLVLRSQLERQARGVDVFFVGERTDVDQWLKVADVLVLTSTWEARALAAQEAMAAGTPVVVPDVGGLPALVEDAGIVVPGGDPAAVAHAVDALLENPSDAARRAERGRELARSWPTVEDEAHAWASRYARALRG